MSFNYIVIKYSSLTLNLSLIIVNVINLFLLLFVI